jgi:hypothetical protein
VPTNSFNFIPLFLLLFPQVSVHFYISMIPPTTTAMIATIADISNLLAALVLLALAAIPPAAALDAAELLAATTGEATESPAAVTYTRWVDVDRPVEVLLVGVPFTTVTTTLLAVTIRTEGEAVSSTPSEVVVSGSSVVAEVGLLVVLSVSLPVPEEADEETKEDEAAPAAIVPLPDDDEEALFAPSDARAAPAPGEEEED